jgi:peroxin-19
LQYPGWLEENKSSLSDKDYINYNKQLQIMEKVCSEFEQETSSDNDETKKKRFTKILSLMEEVTIYITLS